MKGRRLPQETNAAQGRPRLHPRVRFEIKGASPDLEVVSKEKTCSPPADCSSLRLASDGDLSIRLFRPALSGKRSACAAHAGLTSARRLTRDNVDFEISGGEIPRIIGRTGRAKHLSTA